jgi:hypothetical protein
MIPKEYLVRLFKSSTCCIDFSRRHCSPGTIESMPEFFNFFDPTPEEQNVVLGNAATVREAEKLIDSCEHCNPQGADFPFVVILDVMTGSDPKITDYILEAPAKCPRSFREITEKTAVEPR